MAAVPAEPAAGAPAPGGPTVRVAAPPAGTAVVSGRVRLQALARSPRGIRRVEFRVDGRRIGGRSRPPWRLGGSRGTWDVRRLRPGVRRLTVVAVDRSGRRAAAARRLRVVRAASRPWVAIARPRPGARVSGRVPVEAQVAADAGIRRVEFRVDGVRRWIQRRPPWRFGGARGAWRAGRHAAGRHRLTVVAVDRRGRRRAVSRWVRVVRPTPGRRAPTAAGLPPATRFLSPGGSDASACRAGAPCQTMHRAYEVASPGEVVEVGAGSYPNQVVTGSPGRPRGAPVYFRPAPGAPTRISYVHLRGVTDVEVRGLVTKGWDVGTGSDRVTLRNVRSTGPGFVTSATNVAVIGGRIGPLDSWDGIQVKRASPGAPNPSDLLFDGIEIRDLTRNADPSHHTDCMQFGAGERVTIRNSRFHNCATQGVFAREFNGGVIRDWLVENNWFGKSQLGYYSLILSPDLRGDRRLRVRYNSASQAMRLEADGVTAVGNVGPLSACTPRATYRHNVWSNARCAPTDLRAPSRFVDAAGFDLRLQRGSPAVGRGDPADHPATDLFGTRRPVGGRPDAGAHELR